MFRVLLAVIVVISAFAVVTPARAHHDVGPDRVYFPQTGHHLQYAFLEYWRHNGAIHVFGYPITGEFEQDGMTVQYFERAIFEWHPDNPPEHRVLLRRLGAEARDDRGLASHEAFQSRGEDSGAQGRYFPQTGHYVANAFLDYWQNRGGLYIFGYPLSGEFVQDDLTVQYFERAILEWHPDNPANWNVLQERLGAQAAQEDGIDTSPQPRGSGVDDYHANLWWAPRGPAARLNPPAGAPVNEAKWIEIDLTNQQIRAWEGNRNVYSAIVSTGRPAVPTLTGTFRIYVKHRFTDMAGWTPDRGSYNLPDVPYVMYYDRGYGIHGTYWHGSFGTPQSAGCTNLTNADAAWFFGWAPVGTAVYVHGRTPGS
jgi:hypothetical protein